MTMNDPVRTNFFSKYKVEFLALLALSSPLAVSLILKSIDQFAFINVLLQWIKVEANGHDSWGPMQMALDYAKNSSNGLYEKIFFEQKIKFQYAPTSLLPLYLVQLVGLKITSEWLNLFNWIIVASTVFATAFASQIVFNEAGLKTHRWFAIVCGVLSVILYYPLLRAYELGQVQVWINFIFVLACITWLRKNARMTGVLLAIITLLKPQFSLFLLWGCIRRDWEFVKGFAVTALAGLGLSVLVFGVQNHLDYLRVLTFLSQHGESFYANQSINGLLNRAFETGNVTTWQAHRFPDMHDTVRYGTLLTSTLIIIPSLLYARAHRSEILDLQIAALSFTIASPIAWEHHYGILPIVYLTVYAYLQAKNKNGTRNIPLLLLLLMLSFVLTANFFGTFPQFERYPGNLIHSLLFVGILVLLLVMWKCRLMQGRNEEKSDSRPSKVSVENLVEVESTENP